MNPLIFDIETLPTENTTVISNIAASIKPPGNFKKLESIEAWRNENFEVEFVKAVNKTALDGAYGRVACIAWSAPGGQVISTLKDMSEEEVIKGFYLAIEESAFMTDSFCGHNVQFDLQFLKHRSMVLRIKPPEAFLDAMNAKPWDDRVLDTQYIWTNDRNKYISLHALCEVLGIEGKGDFDGSMVADTWCKNPQEVIDYCKDDVRRTYEVFKRLTWA